MAAELKTIKVLEVSVSDLNIVSANTGEKQYEVVGRLAKDERLKIESNKSKKKQTKK